MSEYQYYEFQAVDRPLVQRELAELRKLSTRATITPTRFVNVYNYGDFGGDPAALMDRYFDAHVYIANWGTHQLMLRLPSRLLDPAIAAIYCPGEWVSTRTNDGFTILEFISDDEEGGRWIGEDEGPSWMTSLLSLRAEIATGDLRALYLGWLLAAQEEILDGDAVEPPVPPGLGTLSASLASFAEFLRLDKDLIAVAAQRSAPLHDVAPSDAEIVTWIRDLPETEKTELLTRVVVNNDLTVRAELLRMFQQSRGLWDPRAADAAGGRTVAELRAASEEHARGRQRDESERKAKESARREREQAAARAKYIDSLAGHEDEIWSRIGALIEKKQAKEYDQAVQLLIDLRDLAQQTGQPRAFQARLWEVRELCARRPSLIGRFQQAGLLPG